MTVTTLRFVRRAYDIGNTAAYYLVAVAAAAGLYVVSSALINGPRLRAAAEQERTAEIAAEDRQFCAGFGVLPESARFADCAGGLAAIRQKQEERWRRDTEGFL